MGARQHLWCKNSPEKCRAMYRRRYARKREQIKRRVAEWQAAHREQVRESRRRHDAILRQQVFVLLGDTCSRCGFDDERALQVDHVGGGGNAELRKLGHTRAVYARVLKVDGVGYRLLCANCNTIEAKERLYGKTYDGRTQEVAQI